MDDNQFEITREISIDAAHRVPDHLSKCKNLHGHRYAIQATCVGKLIEDGHQKGMVLDFSFLKEEMLTVIDQPADHATILWEHDPFLENLIPVCGKLLVISHVPTAENLCRYWYDLLHERVQKRSNGNARLLRLRVYETPNCWADYPTNS